MEDQAMWKKHSIQLELNKNGSEKPAAVPTSNYRGVIKRYHQENKVKNLTSILVFNLTHAGIRFRYGL